MLEGQFHKAFAFFQRDGVHPRGTVQRFCSPSDHDDHGVASTVTRQEVVNGVLIYRADTWEMEGYSVRTLVNVYCIPNGFMKEL